VTWSALTSIIVFGSVIRFRGLTTLGLWRDDAWVALSARVGIGSAWHMWVTAPGFNFFEREWISLHPGSTWWDQLPPLVIGIAAIPAVFVLGRYFRLGIRSCLSVSLIVAVCPTCVVYSTRLKEYSTDFLMACLLIALAEATRRRPSTRQLTFLGGASVVGFAVSASTLPVIVGAWLSLGCLALAFHRGLARVIALASAALCGCALVAGAFFRHLSPALHRGWLGFFILHSSPGALVSSTYGAFSRMDVYLIDIPNTQSLERVALFTAVTGLAILGLTRSRAMLCPALVLGSAMLASAFGVIPLGTDRTDQVLYPALLLLVAAGLGQLRSITARVAQGSGSKAAGTRVVVILVISSLLLGGATLNGFYPGTDTRGLASALSHTLRPGDHIVVDELMRYPWAEYEDPTLHLIFGTQWNSGFSVASTQPGVFIVPSEYYEGGSTPVKWAAEMAPYRRLWFVESPPLGQSPTYRALLRDGWHRVSVIRATGCAAILLERT
jgi:hypothetical protein